MVMQELIQGRGGAADLHEVFVNVLKAFGLMG